METLPGAPKTVKNFACGPEKCFKGPSHKKGPGPPNLWASNGPIHPDTKTMQNIYKNATKVILILVISDWKQLIFAFSAVENCQNFASFRYVVELAGKILSHVPEL